MELACTCLPSWHLRLRCVELGQECSRTEVNRWLRDVMVSSVTSAQNPLLQIFVRVFDLWSCALAADTKTNANAAAKTMLIFITLVPLLLSSLQGEVEPIWCRLIWRMAYGCRPPRTQMFRRIRPTDCPKCRSALHKERCYRRSVVAHAQLEFRAEMQPFVPASVRALRAKQYFVFGLRVPNW